MHAHRVKEKPGVKFEIFLCGWGKIKSAVSSTLSGGNQFSFDIRKFNTPSDQLQQNHNQHDFTFFPLVCCHCCLIYLKVMQPSGKIPLVAHQLP